jgi:hypothetical protein
MYDASQFHDWSNMIRLRTLYALHWHILNIPEEDFTNARYKTVDKWLEGSHAALNTITKITLDIADSHDNMHPHMMETLPPSCAYIIRAALRHIRSRPSPEDPHWLQNAEERLQSSLAQMCHRWSVGDY